MDAAIEELLSAAAAAEPTFAERRRVRHSLVAAQVDKITALGKELGMDKVDEQKNLGHFDGLLTTDLRDVNVDESTTTMSRLTFARFGPLDMKVRLGEDAASAATGLPDQIKATSWEDLQNGYIVHAHFAIIEEYDGLVGSPQKRRADPVLGYTSAIAEFSLPGPGDPPNRLGVTFRRFRIAPAQPEKHLGRWLQLLKPHNPSMDSDGVAEVVFDKPPVGSLDYLVMTDKYQVSQGNLGSVVVMRRRDAKGGGW